MVARIFAIRTPLPGARPVIRERGDSITPDERAGDFAQAMMDLGSGICGSRDAKCLLCPLQSVCRARAEGDPLSLPVKSAKRAKPQRLGTAFWIERDEHVWLVTRPPRGMLGGMRALPDDGWTARVDGVGEAPLPGAWRAGGVVRHSFTHADLELGVAIFAGEPGALAGGEWWPVDHIAEAGLPTLFAKVAAMVLANR